MLKVFGLIFLFLSLKSWARPCKVYGISDSPQNLSCTIPKMGTFKLACIKGKYQLNGTAVEMAFHMDVEEGSSPMVFKTKNLSLTVVEERGKFKCSIIHRDK